MTTLVLGHLVLDEIHSYDGNVYHSPGGITFPLRTFAALQGEGDRLRPVFPYGSDAIEALNRMRSEDALDFSACWEVEQPTTRVRLFHESPSQYNTQLVSSLGPIPRQRFAGELERADLVYLNMMTGQDILLDDAAALRGEGRLVYIDLHMIAYRVHRDGRREPTASPQWKDWVSAADVAQCNEREFDALTGCGVQARGGGEREMSALRRACIEDIFEEHELTAFVLTRGEAGADIFPADGGRLHVPAVPPARIVDPTGCGDAFGSTLARGIVTGEDMTAAAARAARAASFVVSIPGSDGIKSLRAHIREASA